MRLFLLYMTSLLGIIPAYTKDPSKAHKEIFSFNEEDASSTIERLSQATEKTLQDIRILKTLIEDFKEQKESFMKGKQDKNHAYLMVQTASRILEHMEKQHIQHLFSPKYLEELSFFASIARKYSPTTSH